MESHSTLESITQEPVRLNRRSRRNECKPDPGVPNGFLAGVGYGGVLLSEKVDPTGGSASAAQFALMNGRTLADIGAACPPTHEAMRAMLVGKLVGKNKNAPERRMNAG